MQIRKMQSIRIVVGQMRGALPDLMQYAFQILTRSRPLFEHARLEIDTRPPFAEM